ncbi:hypothetical protein Ae201684_017778 [Aphanomyces euteiches]|uniref:Core-binding (CB) domain-containing protein n=1 Tax=Aphanomyces euteiches TaxID=100861 RepID=A0A6G0W818_9STRA|nr:hypothetical protein Ae201684_017778 [Aphanomyces euteiches]
MPVEDFTIQRARAKRISDSTRKGYISGLRQIVKWIKETNMTHLLTVNDNGGEIIDLTVFTYEHFKQFIIHTMQSKDLEPNTLSKYRSSIKSHYKDMRMPIPDDYGEDLKEILSGKCMLRSCKLVKKLPGERNPFIMLFTQTFAKSPCS